MELEKQIKELLTDPLGKAGYELYSLRYYLSKEGPCLEVVVDRDDPISLDDIVSLSEVISPILDEHDPIPGAYNLDISSLGAEKPIALDRLNRYVGRYVNLHLSNPYKGENILEGDIVAVDENLLSLETKVKTRKSVIELPIKDIDRARLAIKF